MGMQAGIEQLRFTYPAADASCTAPAFSPVLVGVVGSGNLEVLIEPGSTGGGVAMAVEVQTSARGFGAVWQAVVDDFQARHGLCGVRVAIHDMGATPAVVSLRLDQAVAEWRAQQAEDTQ